MIYKLGWDALEPEPGRYEPGVRRLDEVLQRASDKKLSVHLLIVCGENAPAWLKHKVGTVTVFDPGGLAYDPPPGAAGRAPAGGSRISATPTCGCNRRWHTASSQQEKMP